MIYQEEERLRLRRRLSQEAIHLAMQGRWRDAISGNKSILQQFPSDVDAFNRLGRAHMELGEYSEAKESYSKAVQLDPYNTIAKKNLQRLVQLSDSVVEGEGDAAHPVEPQDFIEETGKAGVVNLFNLAPQDMVARLVAGDRVYLKIVNSSLLINNGRGEYLGQVEPRHAQRLMRLIQGGNKYTAAFITAEGDSVMSIIIREVYQDPSTIGQPSFPAKTTERFRPYVGERLARRRFDYDDSLQDEAAWGLTGGEEIEPMSEDTSDIDEKG
jgi:tetratricopeptide (TPR) repeat protein